MIQKMTIEPAGMYAEYSLDDTQPKGIRIHRVARGDRTFNDSILTELARNSVRGQLDGWVTVGSSKTTRKRG